MSITLVLAIGLDSWRLATHSALWRPAGYVVLSAATIREAIEHFRNGDFDLVLLGRSLSKESRERLTYLIRSSGSLTPVVSIADDSGDSDLFADATISNDSNALLTGMGQLMANGAKLRAKPAIARSYAT